MGKTTSPVRQDTFSVEDGALVRRVVPRRGDPYEHRCPLEAYKDLAWAALDFGDADRGFTVGMLIYQQRNVPIDENEGRERPWASMTNAAVCIAFWKEHGLLETRLRRKHIATDGFVEDAMCEYYALAEGRKDTP